MGFLDVFKKKSGQSGGLYSGGKGGSIEDAILVNAETTVIGVHAEYEYVASKHGARGVDWELETQSLLNHEGKYYDALHIKMMKDGEEFTYYFDISNFFGKF